MTKNIRTAGRSSTLSFFSREGNTEHRYSVTMAGIPSSLPGFNLFSSLPSAPPPQEHSSTSSPSTPIPIPKYPPPKSRILRSSPPKNPNPALKTFHRRTNYYKPVKDGVISTHGDRAVVIGDSGVSYLLPDAPFEFQYSYSETPKVKPIAIREPAFLPFAPPTMPRPWTGKAPLKSSKKKIPLFDSFNPPPPGTKGVKQVEMPGPFPLGKYPKEVQSRDEILGEPLKNWEIRMLVKPHLSHNRQVNLGELCFVFPFSMCNSIDYGCYMIVYMLCLCCNFQFFDRLKLVTFFGLNWTC